MTITRVLSKKKGEEDVSVGGLSISFFLLSWETNISIRKLLMASGFPSLQFFFRHNVRTMCRIYSFFFLPPSILFLSTPPIIFQSPLGQSRKRMLPTGTEVHDCFFSLFLSFLLLNSHSLSHFLAGLVWDLRVAKKGRYQKRNFTWMEGTN